MSAHLPESDEPKQGDAMPARVSGRGKLFRLGLGLVVLVAALYFAVGYLAREEEALARLREVEPTTLILMSFALFGCNVLNGVVTRDLVARFGIRLRVVEWLGITLVTTMLNLVTPLRGGAAVRALYLKQKHGLPYTHFASTLAAMVAFQIAANATLGALCLLALGVPGGVYGGLALGACVAMVAGLALALVLAPAGDATTNHRLIALVLRVVRAWREIARDRVLLLRLTGSTSLNALLHAWAFVLAFQAAGFAGSFWVPATSSAFAKVGTVVAVTPAGLGIFEAFGVVSAQIVGVELAASLVAVLLVRVLSVAVTILGGVIMWPMLLAGPGRQREEEGR